jgi:DNA helicase-2/ATP-dependent DNA helicase PcrA
LLNGNDATRELLRGLNPEQAAAVSHPGGPLLVLAGAGSGKTRVLTRRLAWLVAQGVPQEGIVALTFTNKAAGEMKERVADLLGTTRPRSFVGTFHAFGVRLLRRFHAEAGLPSTFVVFDSDDQLALVKQAMKAANVTDRAFTPRSFQSRISNAKNAGLPPSAYPEKYGELAGEQLKSVHLAYEKGLAASSALDFDDLLLRSVRLLRDRPDVLDLLRRSIVHLLVDEYQDTNGIQADLVGKLAGERRNVFAVGDEDQSIYRWRGADVGNILEFSSVFAGARTIRLERNYRSTAPILAAAGAVVAENRRRLGKTLRAEKAGGEKVRLLIVDEERDEAREIVSRIAAARRNAPGSDVAVLFRTNAQSRPFEDELLRSNIRYVLVGGTRFYERAEVKDALAYLRLCRNGDDDVSFRRVVNVPARGVGAATLDAVVGAAQARGCSLFAALGEPIDGLSERARRALGEFRDLVVKLGPQTSDEEGAGAAVDAVLRETGLLALYAESTDPQDEARRENLDQLVSAAREHERLAVAGDTEDPGVAGFLDAVSLRSDTDEADEKKGVLLMTLHSAKGLEFDEVFLAGVENGSLPHASSREDDDQLEEERRLAYVGMTRARDRLTLSLARRRMVRGEWLSREPSPFLDAIPEELLRREDLTSRGTAAGRGGFSGEEGGLFPDYEGESQETPRPASRRFPVATPPPRRTMMRRTPPPPTASGFRRGARVMHPDYGPGVILTIEGSGDAEKLTVYFDRAGRKKFVARFANLSPG